MATGDIRIYACNGVPTHGGTGINSARSFSIPTDVITMTDPGNAAAPGVADEQTVYKTIEVAVNAMDPDELYDFVDAAAANWVGYFLGEAGAAKQATIKNVKFTRPPSFEMVPRDQGGGVMMHVLRGRALWGASDTWATMIVIAAKP